MAMDGESHDSGLLDLKFSPYLLFDYNGYESWKKGEDDDDETDDDGSNDDDTDPENDDDDGESNDGVHETEADDANRTTFFYSIPRKVLLAKTVDDLKHHIYWITPQGWLLMLHPSSHQNFLWNPYTNKRIGLPLDQDGFLTESPVRCLLSHRPTDPACVVLAVSTTDTILWYCHPGGNQWLKHVYQPIMLGESRSSDVVESMAILTAVGEKFYTELSVGRILTLEFLPYPVFTVIHVECASDTGFNYFGSVWTLLESRGELHRLSFHYPAFCEDKIVCIGVHKLDLPRKAWVKVDTLGDRVFFRGGELRAASRSAEEVGLKANCIYFRRPHDKALYVHNMERGTTAMHNPGLDLPDDMEPQIMIPPS